MTVIKGPERDASELRQQWSIFLTAAPFFRADTREGRLQTSRDAAGDNYMLIVCDCDLGTIVTGARRLKH